MLIQIITTMNKILEKTKQNKFLHTTVWQIAVMKVQIPSDTLNQDDQS